MSLTDGVVALRPWVSSDAGEIVAAIDGDPEIARWLDQVPQPYTLADALAYLSGEGMRAEDRFAVVDVSDGRVLGSIGVGATHDGVREIGYWLRADARGGGVMTRALVLATSWAFTHDDVVRVQLRADPENTASCRVAEKAGFRREGVLRSAHWNPRLGRRQDWTMYSILRDEASS